MAWTRRIVRPCVSLFHQCIPDQWGPRATATGQWIIMISDKRKLSAWCSGAASFRWGAFRCIPCPHFHVSLLALRMQPPCEAAAGTFSEQEGQENSWSAAFMQHFSFRLGPAGDSLGGNCWQIFTLIPHLIIQRLLRPRLDLPHVVLLSDMLLMSLVFFFFFITALPKYDDQWLCRSFIFCCKVYAKGSWEGEPVIYCRLLTVSNQSVHSDLWALTPTRHFSSAQVLLTVCFLFLAPSYVNPTGGCQVLKSRSAVCDQQPRSPRSNASLAHLLPQSDARLNGKSSSPRLHAQMHWGSIGANQCTCLQCMRIHFFMHLLCVTIHSSWTGWRISSSPSPFAPPAMYTTVFTTGIEVEVHGWPCC